MKTFQHNKVELATAVARNQSKLTNELVRVFSNGIKSVKTMKFCDTTVLQVANHSQLPNITASTGMVIVSS